MPTKPPKRKAKPVCDWLVTSTYQRYNRVSPLAQSAFAPIRTTRGAPRFPLTYELAGKASAIVPHPDLKGLGEDDFRDGYYAQLDATGWPVIAGELLSLHQRLGKPLALLCFCKLEEGEAAYCHRRVFADWYEARTGQSIPEV